MAGDGAEPQAAPPEEPGDSTERPGEDLEGVEAGESGALPAPALPSEGGLFVSVLGGAALGAVLIALVGAERIPLGAAQPFAAPVAAVLLALLVHALCARFARREREARNAMTAGLLAALAERAPNPLGEGEPLAESYARSLETIEAAIREREEDLRQASRRDLVRVRSQCEALVEKHVERVHREGKEKDERLDVLVEEREIHHQAWLVAQREAEAASARLEKDVEALKAKGAELEAALARVKEENASIKAGRARSEEEAAARGEEAAARGEEAGRLAREVERLTRDLESARARGKQFAGGVLAQLRSPVQIVGQIAAEIATRLGSPPAGGAGSGSPDAALEEKARAVRARASQLQCLLERFDDLRRLETGTFRLVYSQCDLARSVSALVNEFAAVAAEKGVDLSGEVPKGFPVVITDERLATKALRELLANAVRFTDRGGRVTLRAAILPAGEGRREAVELTVSDTGRGVAPGDRDRIFEPFQEGSRNNGLARGGPDDTSSGLGLALARGFVGLLGGELALEAPGDDGSAFRARIPVQTVERAGY
jgi:signal transduction histidine kinase